MRRKLGWSLVGVTALAFVAPSCGSNANNGGGGPGSGDGGILPSTNDGSFGPLGLGDGGFLPDGQIACEETCPAGLVCDHGLCEPPQKQCVSNADCNYDTYCDSSGQCVPYGSPPDGKTNDPGCSLSIPPGAFAPRVFCEFKPAAADPFAAYVDVQATPAVVNFNVVPTDGGAPAGPPSIIAPFTVPVSGGYTENMGILRVLSGADCSLQQNLGGGTVIPDFIRSSSAVALGDLDGDGVPEIVAYTGDDSVVAFTLKAGTWKALWTPATATTAGARFTTAVPALSGGSGNWGAPSIHDLDDDGKPEIIVEGYVINGQTGVLRTPLPADYTGYYVGIPPVIANMNGDNKAEMTDGAHLWTYDGATSAWVDVPTYSQATPSPAGWAGVADFNPYDGKKQPEIAVASNSTLSVFNIDHSVFAGMTGIAVPGGGGGPPTIADYDGDGLPEIGLAGQDFYTVFDPDCQGTPRTGGKCGTSGTTACDTTTLGAPTNCPTFILWSKKTQDHSSNITGSSVFDFEASGTAQVVYADECFARVYAGPNGAVQFSQYHSSCTWIENPIVADVDGDFHAELVVMSNTACGPSGTGPGGGIDCSATLDSSGVDLTFVGEQCQANADCVSGVCDSGYCRCTASADCCSAKTDAACIEAGQQCAPPPAGTPGAGNTCRAPHPHGVQGIRVYKDAQNRWVRSRTIWNQHSYAVTNVNEDGTIPQTSKWTENWTTAGLNDFRQNVPGQSNGKAIGDPTAQAGPNYTCSGTQAIFDAPVCNRGAAPIGAGLVVGFYVGTTKVCSATTATPLPVGACEVVSCTWSSPPNNGGAAVDVTVVANDGNGIPTCDTSNNKGLVEHVFCGQAR